MEIKTCERCGGSVGNIALGGTRFCACARANRRDVERLHRVDPRGSMTFNSLDQAPANLSGARDSFFSGHGVAMFGNPGTGKTHLSVAACRHAVSEGLTAGYYNVAELASRIRDTYSNQEYGADSRRAIVEDVSRHDLVVLDDLGKEHASEDAQTIIYELINAVYQAGRQLIVASNLPPGPYEQRYDDAVRSRIAGMCDVYVIAAKDRRRA